MDVKVLEVYVNFNNSCEIQVWFR